MSTKGPQIDGSVVVTRNLRPSNPRAAVSWVARPAVLVTTLIVLVTVVVVPSADARAQVRGVSG